MAGFDLLDCVGVVVAVGGDGFGVRYSFAMLSDGGKGKRKRELE